MKVTLLPPHPDALDILLYTKETRLAGDPEALAEVKAWPMEKKMANLDYMRGTIQSSWEFVDYVFVVSEVSRAYTHQAVRTRPNSYAQQSQRTVDMSGAGFVWPETFTEDQKTRVEALLNLIDNVYKDLTEDGVPNGDARSILPTNIATNIVIKTNLRTMADTAKVRLCYRTQGEYQDVFRAMRDAVIVVHPWAEPFIRVHCAAVGTCAFPNFMECPIKGPVYNADTGIRWDGKLVHLNNIGEVIEEFRPNTRDEQQKLWEISPRFVANPSQTGGRK